MPTKQARGRAVYDALRQVAQRTQAPLRAQLDALGVEYRPFYVINMLAVQGDARLALALAARPDVARLEANPSINSRLPTVQPPTRSPAQPSTLTWGVQNIRAAAVWDLGYTGQGIVVAGGDTGYDWDHPALKDKYRGWDGVTANHDYNWHDAIHSDGSSCGADAPAPCDDRNHGTHTMGTMVGSDGENQIGVAPGARWIGCRNMDNGVGTPASYTECFEFFLAPYPIGGDPQADGDPDLAPHVINNSWICPSSEGCDADSLRSVVENTRAAGIVVVAVASNRGGSCSSVSTPISLFEASFSVGAIDQNDQITYFSARGPVTVDGSQRRKPDVSAPGLGVYSSLPGGYYGNMNGTSMAAPHVAGLIA
ncbi:MAG: S8 family serine peptidase, partial [Delftia sp.]|nr:S8 family serine peptidase [Delftia sp.]